MQIDRKGEVKPSCILVLVLLAVAIFAAIRGVPPYYNSTQFLDEVDSATRSASSRGINEAKLMEKILNLANQYEQPVTRDHVSITKAGSNLVVKIDYSLPIDFGVTTYELPRQAKFVSLSGSF